jgi:hypothetical protein
LFIGPWLKMMSELIKLLCQLKRHAHQFIGVFYLFKKRYARHASLKGKLLLMQNRLLSDQQLMMWLREKWLIDKNYLFLKYSPPPSHLGTFHKVHKVEEVWWSIREDNETEDEEEVNNERKVWCIFLLLLCKKQYCSNLILILLSH